MDQAAESLEIITVERYRSLLRAFDASVCEATAISQAAAGRLEAPFIWHTARIFARLCSHSQSLVRAAPLSRWTSSESEHWDFGAVAGHARAIMEGYLLLVYISKEPDNLDEWSTRLDVMHLNDCTRRIRLFTVLGGDGQLEELELQAAALRQRLRSNAWFGALSEKRKKDLLSGQPLTISSREQQIEAAGFDKKRFDGLWVLFSQYAHILPLSFYRMEPNGRGTGIRNDTDMAYIGMALEMCTEVMGACTDRMIQLFPDTASERKGLDSKFAPGPRSNLPRALKRGRRK